MLFSTSVIAVLGMVSHASAHMQMSKPIPYASTNQNNFPLERDGSNFPCKGQADGTAPTQMALGSTQPLEFLGTAVHGGGSCQISITYDPAPSKNSVFKVIKSFEGGCPARNSPGNNVGPASDPDPDKYSFTIPTDLPLGKATIAWTWFNKIGNREMYMNCGPINLVAGASKRSNNDAQLVARDQASFNALPNMFTANILNIGNDACTTSEGKDLVFPHPGASVEFAGSKSDLGGPGGTCVDGAGSGAAAAPPPAGASSAPAASAPAASAGVFATVASSNPAPAATSAAASNPPASSPAPSAVPSPASPPAAVSPSAPASPAATASPVASSGSTTPGSPCSPEGLWNCIGGTSFQQCGSGMWSVVQQLASGTTCTPGQSAAIHIVAAPSKRAIRFSSEHIRRHVRKST